MYRQHPVGAFTTFRSVSFDVGDGLTIGNAAQIVELQIVGRNMIHFSRPFPAERSARFLFPTSAIKAPWQMLFDHRKFQSSNRIEMITVEIAIGDVVEFVHEFRRP